MDRLGHRDTARPASRRPASRRPVLALIEGLDCSGKSTIIAVVAAHLRHSGYAVREIDGGTLAPDAVNRAYLWACRDRPYELLRRLAYRTCVLVDRLTFHPQGPDFVLQHSYVHRQLAFEVVAGGWLARAWSRAMASIAVRHDVRILLTVDLNERIARYRQRGFRTERKDFRFGTRAGLAYLAAMDAALKQLASGASYLVVDTTGQSVEETAATVLAALNHYLSDRGPSDDRDVRHDVMGQDVHSHAE